ncbi:LytR C-terminal domain-containing protein [Nocardioides panacisoli]|uniref:LytR/CpsA/Psr regulator C-terminal domain-containing protein n=1 Tax=Nocardioides panacisoli TaxID=627624 RepID=A0ABP7I0T2_9ACTN
MAALRRNERGAVLPSPVVLFSIVVLAVAAVTFFVTRGDQPTEREITQASQESTPSGSASGSSDPTDGASDDASDPASSPTEEPTRTPPPPIQKDQVGVNVYNNTTVAGLAGEVLAKVDDIGWNGLAADNWYGSVPATTVYYPDGMKREGRQLALDLGIQRVLPADTDSDMSTDNLTVILTGALG